MTWWSPLSRRVQAGLQNAGRGWRVRDRILHTSGPGTKLDHVEAGATYRATVGAFHPGLQAIVMKIVATWQKMRDKLLVLGDRLRGRRHHNVVKLAGMTLAGIRIGMTIVRKRGDVGGGRRCFVLGDEVAKADYASLGHVSVVLEKGVEEKRRRRS